MMVIVDGLIQFPQQVCFARFFQEKICEAPEPSWLELRWILSCPRVRDVHRAELSNSKFTACAKGCIKCIVSEPCYS